jgi:UDP:flavonoid glycosyltransferase YjiC (YdhE family)
MSRFLFSAIGSLGDLHPYIAIARELAGRGHEAVIATAEEFRAPVEAAGVGFARVGPSVASFGDYGALMARAFDPRRGIEYMVRELVMPNVRAVHADLVPVAEGMDVLVSHPLGVALPLVAQRTGQPWVATVLAPMSLMSAHDPPVLPLAPWLHALRALGPAPHRWLFRLAAWRLRRWEAPLHELRSALGLPASPHPALLQGQFSPLCNLALFDRVLAEPQPDWPARTVVCGTALYDGKPVDDVLRAEVEAFLAAGDAPIVFALGSSAVWIAGDFWDRAIAAARALGRRAILLTGPATPPALPDTMRAFPYLPYSSVFPRAAVVVHQAGIGTLAQALRAGRPQLMVPVSFDQPDNARRAAALGVARVLPFRRATVARLTAELSALLDETRYASAAATLAESLAGPNGAASAADALIACLADNRVMQGIEQARRHHAPTTA